MGEGGCVEGGCGGRGEVVGDCAEGHLGCCWQVAGEEVGKGVGVVSGWEEGWG